MKTSLDLTKGIPEIYTERLVLRPFLLKDAPEVQRMAGSIRVAEMTATIPHPYPEGAAEEWIGRHDLFFKNGDLLTWALQLRDSSELIGCLSLAFNKPHRRAELGYWIGEEFWGQGYCSEAAIAAIDFAFKNYDLNKINARHIHVNPASGKVMQKAGMVQEGYLRQEHWRNGGFVDMVVYGLLRGDLG